MRGANPFAGGIDLGNFLIWDTVSLYLEREIRQWLDTHGTYQSASLAVSLSQRIPHWQQQAMFNLWSQALTTLEDLLWVEMEAAAFWPGLSDWKDELWSSAVSQVIVDGEHWRWN